MWGEKMVGPTPLPPPQAQGFENAVKAGAREVAIFTAASEAFNRKNLNCSVDDSLRKFDDVVAAAKREGVAVRGYVSCVVGCPYQVRAPTPAWATGKPKTQLPVAAQPAALACWASPAACRSACLKGMR